MRAGKKRKRGKHTALSPGNEEFYSYIKDLVHHPYVLKMKKFPHHCETSCYQHCLNVAYYNYRICKFFHLDARSAARATIYFYTTGEGTERKPGTRYML